MASALCLTFLLVILLTRSGKGIDRDCLTGRRACNTGLNLNNSQTVLVFCKLFVAYYSYLFVISALLESTPNWFGQQS